MNSRALHTNLSEEMDLSEKMSVAVRMTGFMAPFTMEEMAEAPPLSREVSASISSRSMRRRPPNIEAFCDAVPATFSTASLERKSELFSSTTPQP